MRANGLQEEALARSVAAHQEAEAGPAVRHELEVVQKRLDLALASDGDVGESDARYDAALEGVDDDRCDAPGHLGYVAHGAPLAGLMDHSY